MLKKEDELNIELLQVLLANSEANPLWPVRENSAPTSKNLLKVPGHMVTVSAPSKDTTLKEKRDS